MYLSYIKIENYKGIQEIETEFDPNINILIGENGSCKSAFIDAIRILYNIGEPLRDISVHSQDFFQFLSQTEDVTSVITATTIKFTYEFKGLTDSQKGAFFEYLVIDPEDELNVYAKITISYDLREGQHPKFTYNTGDIDGQKADFKTFELFQHYYLSALRDSTRDLLNTRKNILGKVIRRFVKRNETESDIEEIIKEANNKLLKRPEVCETRDGVNSNLERIFKNYIDNKIGLRIEEAKTEYIVNAIKPFLPHKRETLNNEGFHLWQNSLGLNNLIYIAVVLGDVSEQIEDNGIPHFALLIEEPEAHLHPQLQLSLYNFLTAANNSKNSQLFISTHSPTLTSKVPLKNLILLDNDIALKLDSIFNEKYTEDIVENTKKGKHLSELDIIVRQKKLERYIDVTKSQLFYSKAVLFVEGISEELLINSFTQLIGYLLEDYRIEMVNIRGTSFYPFIYLFNSQNKLKRINKKITILTDDDRFAGSKKSKYSFSNLILNDYKMLQELDEKIQLGEPNTRIANLKSVKNNIDNINISTAFKTLEYELAISNVNPKKNKFKKNLLVKYVKKVRPKKIKKIENFLDAIETNNLTNENIRKVGILLWKSLPQKAEFAQDFSLFLLDNLDVAKKSFNIPKYIVKGLKHLTD